MDSSYLLLKAFQLVAPPGPYINESLSNPPDIVDDTQEHMDDTYVEATANQEGEKEEMIAEASEYENDDAFNYDKIQE